MANLIIREAKSRTMFRLPHLIVLNARPLGVLGKVGKEALKPQLKTEPLQANIALPAGHYVLRIQSMIKWISSTIEFDVNESAPTVIEFDHKEFWWDMLFLVDIIAWIVQLFVTFENPWNIVYEVVSNGAFLVWLFHEFRIRNKYFKFQIVENLDKSSLAEN